LIHFYKRDSIQLNCSINKPGNRVGLVLNTSAGTQ